MIKIILLTVTLTFLTVPALAQEPTPTPTPSVITADRIGINNPSPDVPLHIKVRYPADTTASESLIMFKTPTETDPAGIFHTPFEIYQRSTVFGNDRTDSVGIGFSGIGGSQGMGNFGFLFEDAYGFPPQAELHLIYTPFDGSGQHRPWTWTIDRQTGKAVVVTSGTSHFYGAGWLKPGGAEFHIQPSTIAAIANLFGHEREINDDQNT